MGDVQLKKERQTAQFCYLPVYASLFHVAEANDVAKTFEIMKYAAAMIPQSLDNGSLFFSPAIAVL